MQTDNNGEYHIADRDSHKIKMRINKDDLREELKNFKISLEEPSEKIQKTHIIQNLFHGALIIFLFLPH